jgi:DNA-binding NarL/FixJ family response regulator
MTEEAAIRVVLADDHDILRQGLKLLLGLQEDVMVVGEARTGQEALELAKTVKPDVVVMDITMPDMDGLEACRRIRSEVPGTQVLMLTMHESEEYFLKALQMGAAGYLVKKAAPSDLQAAVRTVAHGGAFLYPGLAKALVRAYVTQSATTSTDASVRTSKDLQDAAQAPVCASPGRSGASTFSVHHAPTDAQELGVLTPREMEVLTLVAEGYTNQEIADKLVLSVKTVQAHRANVMEKLGLHDITHLVRFALRHRLIPPEPPEKKS